MSKNQFIVILIGIILILFFALGLIYRTGQIWKAAADRGRVNVAALTAEKGSTAILQQLTKSELEDRYGKIIDSLNYRIKRVDGLTRTVIKKEVRTAQAWRDSIVHDTIRIGRTVHVVDSCLSLNIIDRGDTVQISGNLTIRAVAVYSRGKRIHPWWKIWNNSRYPVVTVHSSCGSVEVESVEVR